VAIVWVGTIPLGLWATFKYKKAANKRIKSTSDIKGFKNLSSANKKVLTKLLGKQAPASPEKAESKKKAAIVKVVVNSSGEFCVGGDTFDIKDLLKSKGAHWNSDDKKWIFPAEKQQFALKFFNLSALPTGEVGVSTATLAGGSDSDDTDEKKIPAAKKKGKKRKGSDDEEDDQDDGDEDYEEEEKPKKKNKTPAKEDKPKAKAGGKKKKAKPDEDEDEEA